MSDPQCGTIRDVGINFKSKESGGIIRETLLGITGTDRENTVVELLKQVCKNYRCKNDEKLYIFTPLYYSILDLWTMLMLKVI